MALASRISSESTGPCGTCNQTIARQSTVSPGGARRIVRSDDVLSGRWHLEGTVIPIAVIRADALYGRAELLQQYRFMRLTDDEIDAVLSFEFPPIDAVAVDLSQSSLTLRCVCGEEAFGATRIVSGGQSHSISCICGREWLLSLTPEPETSDDREPSLLLRIVHPR